MSIEDIIESYMLDLYDMNRRYLKNQDIDNLKGIDRLQGMETINLSGNEISDLQYLKDNNIVVDSVLNLDLSNNNLKTLEGIECFPDLRNLHLYDNKNLMDLKGIQYLKNLKSVSIHGCGFPIDYDFYTLNELKRIAIYYERKSKIKKITNV